MRICSQIDLGELRKSGSTVLRGWIEGTPRPAAIRLHNSSPAVVHFRGGEDQILHTACKRHSRFRVKVVAVGPGTPRLLVRAYDPTPRREASRIAAEIAPLLRGVETQFQESRNRLAAPAGAAGLLDATEKTLLAILTYQELAPLRDYAQVEFRQARAALRRESAVARSGPRGTPHPRPGVVLAAFSAVAPPSYETAGERILRLLRRLKEMAEDDDLAVDICVASEPGRGAPFKMYPVHFPTLKQETVTNNFLRNVFRGRYAYESRKGLWPFRCKPGRSDEAPSCATLDLINRERQIIDCDLDHRTCYLRDDPGAPASCSP